MARRDNELFIGAQHLNDEGRSIKHQGLISEFGTPTLSKISDTALQLTGIDLETNHKTAELKLLGTWDGVKYRSYLTDFLVVLFNLVQDSYWRTKKTKLIHALAYWNKLDPFVLYKQFLLLFDEEKQTKSMERYGKISGEWSTYKGKWKVKPVMEVEIKKGMRRFRFGIKNVIRSSIQFYFYEMIGDMPKQLGNNTYPLSVVWAFDIASLFKNGLAKEMDSRKDIFPYYSKVSEDAHLVDWDKFYNDKYYRNGVVLRSNEYDARAVYDLGTLLIEQFKRAFHYYPKNLISSGSIARASIVATLKHKYKDDYETEKELDKKVFEEFKSIGIMKYYDIWADAMDHNALKDMFCLFYEAYSGGYIEAILYGYIEKGFYVDLAGAYIKHLEELLDLRDSKVTYGTGEPPHIDNSYCVIRGTIKIPIGENYVPITVKHVELKDTNVRAVGEYIGSYYLEERDYMISRGATFTDEAWYNIETTGKLSPIAEVATDFTALRQYLISIEDSAEYMAKTSSASLYGILFEATDTFKESDQLEVLRTGYRGGELLNPLFAGRVTARTRIQIAQASQIVEDNGGEPVLLMTDAVFVKGSTDTLPDEFIRHVKTIGYFETPVEFNEMACLGTGRYSYVDSKKGYITTKNRGLNVVDFHNPDGIDIGEYNWLNGLKLAEATNSFEIMVKTRMLVSVGIIAHTKEITSYERQRDGSYKEIKIPLTVQDLGRVMETYRKVDLVTGLTKRILDKPMSNLKVTDISRGYVGTRSIHYSYGMRGDGKPVDQTLSFLRDEVMKLTVKTAKKRDLTNRSKASYKYSQKVENKSKILKTERDKYAYIRSYGFDRDTAKKWCKRSKERIDAELLKGRTLVQ